MDDKLKWWMSVSVALWTIFNIKRHKMYILGLEQGFSHTSSYYSAMYANKELINNILNK